MDASQFSIPQHSLVSNERMDSNFQSFPNQSNILGKQQTTTTNNTANPTTINSFATTTQQNDKQSPKSRKSKDDRKSLSPMVHFSDTENQQFDDQIDMSMDDEDQSSDSRTKSYSAQRSKHSSPKSSGDASVDDRRIRRQIANCNERRRMQSINAGFAALRQFLPQRCGEKLSKAAILQQTAELIQSLQLEKCRHASGERCAKSTSDEEATVDNDRPQCKKRRTVIKNEPKEPTESINVHEKEDAHRGIQIVEYNKIIEELRSALGKEQQLRLLYEQKLTELKTTLSTSLGFGSMPTSINVDRNEATQQPTQQQRSSSADNLLAPKNPHDLQSNNAQPLAFQYNNNNLINDFNTNYNMRMARPSNINLSALLSPNQFGGTSPSLAQQIFSNQISPLTYLLTMLQTNYDTLPLTSPPIPAQQMGPTPGAQQPNLMTNQDAISKIHNVIRQLENENAKNFPDTLSSDVLVR